MDGQTTRASGWESVDMTLPAHELARQAMLGIHDTGGGFYTIGGNAVRILQRAAAAGDDVALNATGAGEHLDALDRIVAAWPDGYDKACAMNALQSARQSVVA